MANSTSGSHFIEDLKLFFHSLSSQSWAYDNFATPFLYSCMFGGVVNTTNSPHLWKSGSRPVFAEPGDIGNSAEEVLLHSTEANEMKGVGTSLHSAAMMLSPTFLWRFKVLLFFIWGFSCCKLLIGWESVMRMSADLRDLFLYEAFLYYNPLLVTFMVWLWGVNLWVFSQAGVYYATVFDRDQNHLTYREIWKCATWMTIIVPTSMTAYLYLYSHGEVSLAASQPVCVETPICGVPFLSLFGSFLFSNAYRHVQSVCSCFQGVCASFTASSTSAL
ncbi:hypothetical protein Ancab_008004 [Ancistrocladus abbreviatus]